MYQQINKTATFSSKRYIAICKNEARKHRIKSIIFFTLLLSIILLSKQEKFEEYFKFKRINLVIFLVLIGLLLASVIKLLNINAKRIRGKESKLNMIGNEIVYEIIASREGVYIANDVIKTFYIRNCKEILENDREYIFYGNFKCIVNNFIGNHEKQCNKVIIPKCYDGLDEMIFDFRKINGGI